MSRSRCSPTSRASRRRRARRWATPARSSRAPRARPRRRRRLLGDTEIVKSAGSAATRAVGSDVAAALGPALFDAVTVVVIVLPTSLCWSVYVGAVPTATHDAGLGGQLCH